MKFRGNDAFGFSCFYAICSGWCSLAANGTLLGQYWNDSAYRFLDKIQRSATGVTHVQSVH